MNARTAKLIRRYAAANGYRAHLVRRLWNRLPRPLRHARRVQIQNASQFGQNFSP